MSLNELAVDLTCDPVEFTPATTRPKQDRSNTMPGSLFPEDNAEPVKPSINPRRFQVHGGILRMSRVMGAHGKPVHVAVKNALQRNKGYGK